jgi:uroporphyrinogen decarboxylase
MNSRERVLMSLNHQEPDRVPLDLGGNQSGIHMDAYLRLIDYLGIKDPYPQFYNLKQHIVVPCEALLQRLHIDTRYLYPPSNLKPLNVQLQNEKGFVGEYDQFGVFWGNDAKKPRDQIKYLDPVIPPLESLTTIPQIKEYNWPNGADRKPLVGLREIAKALHDQNQYAIASMPIGCIYEYTTFLFGFKTAMKHLLRHKELIMATMEHIYQYWIDYAEAFFKEVGDYVDLVAVNGDLATQAGPIMNLEIYKTLINPIETRFVNHIHRLSKAKINYHSCGAITDFIPYFIKMGYDATNPTQVGATGMVPRELKAKFGKDITFMGGLCDPQRALSNGTPDQVKTEVINNLTYFKSNGGYIGANVHNITAEVPAENIVAMFDTAYQFQNPPLKK